MTHPTATRRCAEATCRVHLAPRWPHPHCRACHAARNPDRPPRPGTTQVRVAVLGSVSTAATYAPVSLPAYPWEAQP